MNLYVAVADLGAGPPLVLDQTEPQRAKKCFLGDGQTPPPARKVWIRLRVDIGWDRF